MSAAEHRHAWGAVTLARFTGNPYRPCIAGGCGAVSLDLCMACGGMGCAECLGADA